MRPCVAALRAAAAAAATPRLLARRKNRRATGAPVKLLGVPPCRPERSPSVPRPCRARPRRTALTLARRDLALLYPTCPSVADPPRIHAAPRLGGRSRAASPLSAPSATPARRAAPEPPQHAAEHRRLLLGTFGVAAASHPSLSRGAPLFEGFSRAARARIFLRKTRCARPSGKRLVRRAPAPQ